MMKQEIRNSLSILLCSAGLMEAQIRISSDYEIQTEVVDSAGGRSSSSSYTNDGSIGGIVGISTVAGPPRISKAGYIGQLYEAITLRLAATSTVVDEEGNRQLSAKLVFDDASTSPLAVTSIEWSVESGALASISEGGLAIASIVYEDTTAVVRGTYKAFTNTLNLTVVESIRDNFGVYAGDGLSDNWQVRYLGLSNPDSAPADNPDGDALDNLFEFAFGTDPGNGSSGLDSVAYSSGLISQLGQPTTSVTNITYGIDFLAVFGRRKDYLAVGLTYQVQFSSDLVTWTNSIAPPTVVASDAEMEVVTVRYPFFLPSGHKARFFRVSVSLNP
jgi:hypothetical protein